MMAGNGGISRTKDERYAQNLAAGMLQLEAFHDAGFKGDEANASRKANTPKIRVRVDQILDARLASLIVDKRWVMNQLVKTYYRAADDREHGACNQALRSIGQELGMFADKRDIRLNVQFERLSDQELLKQLEEVTGQLAISDQSETDDPTTKNS